MSSAIWGHIITWFVAQIVKKHKKEEEQHKFCPKEQSTTWCKYYENKKIYNHKKYLPAVFCSDIWAAIIGRIFGQLSKVTDSESKLGVIFQISNQMC